MHSITFHDPKNILYEEILFFIKYRHCPSNSEVFTWWSKEEMFMTPIAPSTLHLDYIIVIVYLELEHPMSLK